MRSSPLALMLAGLFALGTAHLSFAQPATGEPAKQTPEQAKKQAEEAAKKEATLKAATTAQPGAPAGATPGPNAIPVPTGTPIDTKKLDNGLVIEDLKIGEGYEIKAGDWLSVNYHGMLKDGTVFQSSFYTGEPVLLSLDHVIDGWKQGLPGMKLGGVRRLTIPSALAYGHAGQGTIPADADLTFIIRVEDALQTTDIKVGDGELVGPPPTVCVTAFSMKDSSGKEVASATKEHPYIWIPNELAGVSVGLEGMKVGGKRLIKIPATMNQSHPQLAGDRPQKIPVTVEIELLAVRNLAPPAPRPVPAPPTQSPPTTSPANPAPAGK